MAAPFEPHPLEHFHTLLTVPQLTKDSADYTDPDPTPINEDKHKQELSIHINDLVFPIRVQPPGSLLKDGPSLPDSQTFEDPSREGSETMSSSDYYSETSSFFEPSRISAPHLKIGKYVRVKVKILRVRNLDKNCANILLQNRFLYENQDPYSSNIYANDGESCELNHLHVYRIKVSTVQLISHA